MTRRPRALLSPWLARLAPLTLLAVFGSLQWARYVDGASTARALAWAGAGAITGALVLAAGERRAARAAAVIAGAGLALAASGLELRLLAPGHLDELGNGIARGAGALNAVRLPYTGAEPWVLTTVGLAGAALCWLAGLLACWPGQRPRHVALGLLLVLAAAPIVSLGGERPALIGLLLAALTAAFLWLDRVVWRPGLSLAVLVGAVALTAVPVGSAADREQPWFDYREFSEQLAGGTPVTFDWDHQYGPIDWGREGIELFRVRSRLPHYWKVQTLNEFDGRLWTSSVRRDYGDAPADDLPVGPLRRDWQTRFSVDISRLESDLVVGSGSTLAITDSTRDVEPGEVPGEFVVSDGKSLSKGDSYAASAYVPTPSPDELAEATSGRDPRRLPALVLDVELRQPVQGAATATRPPLESATASVAFPPFGSGRPPVAEYRDLGYVQSGAKALENSYYDEAWRLAQRLAQASETPYEYVLAVNAYLRGPGFTYTETPPRTPAGEAPLEDFLFGSRQGYCQQFSGAMTLLLRMGGVPARVATGFTPGGQPPTGGWVVRDTDAHSWVEAWFDGIGWVTFDPTPPATPARSQTAAINPPTNGGAEGGSGSDAAQTGPAAANRDPSGLQRDNAPPVPSPAGGEGNSPLPWLALALLGVFVGAALLAARRASARTATPQGALAELERALRRSGRTTSPGTTLSALERRLGVSGDGYLRALRAARYRPGAPAPTAAQRAAFRRELAAGLGWGGRLRALYALPPTLPRRPR